MTDTWTQTLKLGRGLSARAQIPGAYMCHTPLYYTVNTWLSPHQESEKSILESWAQHEGGLNISI